MANNRINYCKFSLVKGYRNKSRSSIVDPSKTIVAPYSQGNIEIFGHNAGRQCVAMSLTTLIFNHKDFICLSEDLIWKQSVFNSFTRQSCEKAFLLLTDLPGMVRIFETQYELQYSESYVGNLFGNCFPIEGFSYCATLTEAFKSLN